MRHSVAFLLVLGTCLAVGVSGHLDPNEAFLHETFSMLPESVRKQLRIDEAELTTIARRIIARKDAIRKAPQNFTALGNYSWSIESISMPMTDGVKLAAVAIIPKPSYPGEKFPVVIWPNSWGCAVIEYTLWCIELASRGYINVEYTSRGWWTSQGHIDGAGSKVRKDQSTVIDWILNQTAWSPDADNIAVAGISYGAGMAVFAMMDDPRVKAAIPMSGWAYLVNAFYNHKVVDWYWGMLLVLMEFTLGKPDTVLKELFPLLLEHKNISEIRAWGVERSPGTSADIAKLNSLGNKPLLFICNYVDRVFLMQENLEYIEQLTTTEKHVMLNPGTHGITELLSAFGLNPNSLIWKTTKAFLAKHLKGKSGNSIAPYTVADQSTATLTPTYRAYPSWPPPTDTVITLYPNMGRAGPRDMFNALSTSAPPNGTAGSTSLKFTMNPGVSTGGVLTDAIGSLGVPTVTNIFATNPDYTFVSVSEPVGADLPLCGTPTLNIGISSDQDRFQANFYFYHVDTFLVAQLLSDGFVGSFTAVPGQQQTISMDLRTFCYTVPAGHRLAFAVTQFDIMNEPNTLSAKLGVHFNNSTLQLHAVY